MKGSSNIVSAIHDIAKAKAHFESFCLDHPGSKGERKFKGYIKKLEWIFQDLNTTPELPAPVREGIKKEWEGDTFQVSAISEKAALVKPEQRELIEQVLDAMLDGEEINIVDSKDEK